MIIDIYQKKLSLGDKYKVFINDILTYVVSKQPLQLKPEILVMGADNNMLKIRIVKCLQWIDQKVNWYKFDLLGPLLIARF